MELLDSIRNERFALEMMHDYLRSLSTRIYEIDYRPLETLDNLDTVDLINFKRYIDSRFESLLETYHLKKNGRYDDSSFYIKTDLIRFRQSMTFKEFIDENFSRIYANVESVNMIDYDSEDIDRAQRKSKRYKAPVYKECEDELSMLKDFSQLVKDVVDSFDDFSEALDQLNSEILEEFELNRDKWYRADTDDTPNNFVSNDRSIAETRRETTLLLCKLSTLMHKRYSVDQRYINTLSRVRRIDLQDESIRLASKFGLEKVNTYYDNTFDLKPLNLNESDLYSFARFITENSVLDRELREYFDSKTISDDIVELNKFTNIIRDAIKMFKDFEDALEQFNDKLLKQDTKRKTTAKTSTQRICNDEQLIKKIRCLEDEVSRSFYNLRYNLDLTYSLDYWQLKSLNDLDKQSVKDFKEDVTLEVDRILKKYGLEKNVIFRSNSFRLRPVDLSISKTMLLQEFIGSNVSELYHDSMFIDSICDVSAEEIGNKIMTLLAEGIMTEQEVEKEIMDLNDFIETMQTLITAFFEFGDDIREINENLVDEYKSSYCR